MNNTTWADNRTWPNVTHGQTHGRNPALMTFDHFSGTVELYKVLFAIIDGMGIIGNILVISTIFLNPNMRSTIYYLLANLAFSDLLFAVLAPFHITVLVNNYNWSFGAVFCKVYYFVFRSFYSFSVINLILITVERFLATRYPLSFRGNPKRTLALILVTWVLSFIMTSPFLSIMTHINHGQDKASCYQNWPSKLASRAYYTFIYVTLYFIPLALMAFMYALISMTLRKQPLAIFADKNEAQRKQFNARKRMSLLVIVIVIAFFICWSPWNIIEFVENARDNPWDNPKVLPTVKNYAMLGTILSSAVNPVLFSFMSFEFRTGFRFVFVRISSWYRLRRGSGDESPTGSSQRTGNMDLSKRSMKRNNSNGEANRAEAKALV